MPQPKRKKHQVLTEKDDSKLARNTELFVQLLIYFGFRNVGDKATMKLETRHYRGEVEIVIKNMEKI